MPRLRNHKYSERSGSTWEDLCGDPNIQPGAEVIIGEHRPVSPTLSGVRLGNRWGDKVKEIAGLRARVVGKIEPSEDDKFRYIFTDLNRVLPIPVRDCVYVDVYMDEALSYLQRRLGTGDFPEQGVETSNLRLLLHKDLEWSSVRSTEFLNWLGRAEAIRIGKDRRLFLNARRIDQMAKPSSNDETPKHQKFECHHALSGRTEGHSEAKTLNIVEGPTMDEKSVRTLCWLLEQHEKGYSWGTMDEFVGDAVQSVGIREQEARIVEKLGLLNWRVGHVTVNEEAVRTKLRGNPLPSSTGYKSNWLRALDWLLENPNHRWVSVDQCLDSIRSALSLRESLWLRRLVSRVVIMFDNEKGQYFKLMTKKAQGERLKVVQEAKVLDWLLENPGKWGSLDGCVGDACHYLAIERRPWVAALIDDQLVRRQGDDGDSCLEVDPKKLERTISKHSPKKTPNLQHLGRSRRRPKVPIEAKTVKPDYEQIETKALMDLVDRTGFPKNLDKTVRAGLKKRLREAVGKPPLEMGTAIHSAMQWAIERQTQRKKAQRIRLACMNRRSWLRRAFKASKIFGPPPHEVAKSLLLVDLAASRERPDGLTRDFDEALARCDGEIERFAEELRETLHVSADVMLRDLHHEYGTWGRERALGLQLVRDEKTLKATNEQIQRICEVAGRPATVWAQEDEDVEPEKADGAKQAKELRDTIGDWLEKPIGG